MIKLATWNVNSLKVRLEQVVPWMIAEDLDVLALQETKVTDDQFPEAAFREVGFQVTYAGQKTYNGMAIISREAIHDVVTDVPDFLDPQRRILAATINDIRVINLYVPNGGEIYSDKYEYKLFWLKQVTQFIQAELTRYTKVVVLGDFNIAPDDRDVHDPAEWENCTLTSAPERNALNALLSLGLRDSFRNFPQEAGVFSWWDYRAAGFRRNRGLRIDLILLSEMLSMQCQSCYIDINPRCHERPSDHAPVVVHLQS